MPFLLTFLFLLPLVATPTSAQQRFISFYSSSLGDTNYPQCHGDGTFDHIKAKIILPTLEEHFKWNVIHHHMWGAKQNRPHYMGHLLMMLKPFDDPRNLQEASCLFNVTASASSTLCFQFNWLYCQVEGDLVLPPSPLPGYCEKKPSADQPDPICHPFHSTFIINEFILKAVERRYEVGVERYSDFGFYPDVQTPCHYYFGQLFVVLLDGRQRHCDYHMYLFKDKTMQNFELNCWE